MFVFGNIIRDASEDLLHGGGEFTPLSMAGLREKRERGRRWEKKQTVKGNLRNDMIKTVGRVKMMIWGEIKQGSNGEYREDKMKGRKREGGGE